MRETIKARQEGRQRQDNSEAKGGTRRTPKAGQEREIPKTRQEGRRRQDKWDVKGRTREKPRAGQEGGQHSWEMSLDWVLLM